MNHLVTKPFGQPETKRFDCPYCGGTRQIEVNSGPNGEKATAPCPRCGGQSLVTK
jgi:transcription elongation factor Elf1